MKRFALFLLLALSANARASEIIPAPPQARPIALKGATIHPVSGPDIAGGTIVFADGKITALAADAPIPEGAEVIDATGKHVYPGLIDANSILGLSEISAVRSTLDYQEVGEINPNARAISSVNPDSELIAVTRANGILTTLTVPDGDLVAGQSVVLRLDGWTPEEMTVRAPAAMHLRWPDLAIDRNPRAAKKPEDQRKDIEKALRKLRDAFEMARAYAKARKVGGPGFESDLRWEALAQVVDGSLPLFVHANSAAQIESALAWAKEAQLKITLVGGREAWRMARQLKESDTPVIVALSTALPPRRGDSYDSSFANAARLQAAGVRYCIATNGRDSEPAHGRNLPYEASQAAAFGLPKEEALKAVTLYPAQLLGDRRAVGFVGAGQGRHAHRHHGRSARFSHPRGSGLHRRTEDRSEQSANAAARQVSRKIPPQMSAAPARPPTSVQRRRAVAGSRTFWNLSCAGPDR